MARITYSLRVGSNVFKGHLQLYKEFVGGPSKAGFVGGAVLPLDKLSPPLVRVFVLSILTRSLSLTAGLLLAKVTSLPALQLTVSCGPLSPSPPVPQPLGSGVRRAERWRKW